VSDDVCTFLRIIISIILISCTLLGKRSLWLEKGSKEMAACTSCNAYLQNELQYESRENEYMHITLTLECYAAFYTHHARS
jgi:hypothetical protein